MADGIVYTAVTRYSVDGLAEAGRVAAGADQQFTKLGGSLERTESTMDRLNRTALSYLGWRQLYQDAKNVAAGFVDVSNAAEQAQFTISALIQAGRVSGSESWVGAMKMGSDYIAQMRKDAQVLPGTFQDLMAIVQPSMLPGLEAGLSLRQIEKLSSDMMAVGKLLQINPVVVGHEMEMLLHGRATNRTPLFAKLSGALGMTAKEFNQLDPDQRINKLNEAVGRFKDAIDAYGQTWDAISSTAEDNITEIQRGLGAAFFRTLKGELEKVNDYYEKHRTEILAMADAVGNKLATGFSKVVGYIKDGFGWLYDHRESLLKIAEVYGAILLGKQISGIGGDSGGLAGAEGKGANMAQGYFALKESGVSLSEAVKLGAAAALGTPGNVLGNFGALYMASMEARQAQAVGRAEAPLHTGIFTGGGAALRSVGRAELMAIGNYGLPSMGQVAGSIATNYAMAHLLNDMKDMSGGFQLLNDGINVTTSALGSLPGPIGLVASGLGVLYQALNAWFGILDKMQKEDIKRDVLTAGIEGNFTDARIRAAGSVYTAMRKYGYRSEDEYGPQMAGGSYSPADAKAQMELAKQVISLTAAGAQYAQDYGAINGDKVSREILRSRLAGEYGTEATNPWVVQRAEQMLVMAQEHLEAKKVLADVGAALKDPEPKKKLHKPNPVVNIYQQNHIYEAEDTERVRVVIRESIEDALYRPTHSALGPSSAYRY